ncbi:MAG: DNA repair protein [Acidobacteria bacterium]|nr:MAG: DNA repair protein [Acidobacteriota bacterium]
MLKVPLILTIGHSTRPIEDFIALLKAHGVERLVDIRTVPRSRTNPQFNRDMLPESLKPVGIDYSHLGALGGLRHARPDSLNTGWRNTSFRGYADYMQTPEFSEAVEELMETARKQQTAIMCAEAVPWRCHRSLVADSLSARGIHVEHIMSTTRRQPHTLTSFAKIEGKRVTYPGTERLFQT